MPQDSKFGPTIFVDLDGVLVKHCGPADWNKPLEILPEVQKTFIRWWNQSAQIIITTGRPECQRSHLVSELARIGLFYQQLVMDCGSGRRYLVNDTKPYDPSNHTAVAINVLRNDGLFAEDLKYLS